MRKDKNNNMHDSNNKFSIPSTLIRSENLMCDQLKTKDTNNTLEIQIHKTLFKV